MSKPPFTPGPWETSKRANSDVVRGEDSGCVAVIPRHDTDGHGYVSSVERAANARLIAAAPDLHEALDWLLACVLADPASEVHPDDKEERLILACGAARTALAKANGQ